MLSGNVGQLHSRLQPERLSFDRLRVAGSWLLCAILLAPHNGSTPQASGTAAETGIVKEPPATKRVLLLHQLGGPGPGPSRARFDLAFAEALRSASSVPLDLYEEAIETQRFPGADQSTLVTDYLKNKYADQKLAVIVAQGTRPLDFARENRHLFGDPPIVTVLPPSGGSGGNDDNLTGLQGGSFLNGTIDLALALRPETQSVFVIDGARENDSELHAEVERQLKERERPLNVVCLRDLPLSDLLSRVAAVGQHSVVVFVRQTMRNGVEDVDPYEALKQVVATSPVPVFSQTEDFLGRGIVGGNIWRYETDARRMAEMARNIANGASARDIPIGLATYNNVLDWRELRRWQIPASRVPQGSVVLFRPASFFELYRRYAVVGFIVFVAQLALIVGLLVQRVRRRRAEKESRNNEERYRSVVDTQSELICRFLPDTTLTFVNDAYCRFWNKPRRELLGRQFIEMIPPSARQEVCERIARLTSGFDSHEHQVLLADGSIGWHHWINHAVLDERLRVIEYQGVGRDITDRKRAEEALGLLEARNTAMLRAIPDLMFVLSRDGTYVDYHARDPVDLFVPPEQFLGKTIREIFPPQIADVLMDAVERACMGEDPAVVEYTLAMRELKYFEARLVCAGRDRVLSIVRDVTESKRVVEVNRDLAGRLITAQEAERRRIARDLHDGVCQEVASVTVDVSYLRQKGGDIQSPEIQKTLLSVQRRAASVAETLRLLSHGLHPSVLHHIGLVAALQAHCGEVERQHHVRVSFFAEGKVEPASRFVALSLFRIAQEALRNAALHGLAQHVTVTLVRNEAELILVVADDGRGFDVIAARQNGGLGLVSIEERARLVKGQATICSEPGGGTTIDVRVPIDAVDQVEERQTEQPARVSRPPAEGPWLSAQ